MRSYDIVDAQVHLFGLSTEAYPWDPALLADPRSAAMRARFEEHVERASPEAMLAEMDANGVAGALVVNPTVYGHDLRYSMDAYRLRPERFRVVARLDPADPDAAGLLEMWSADPAFAGIRINLWAERSVADLIEGRADSTLRFVQRQGLPVCVNAPGRFDLLERLARGFPDLSMVVDHLGLFHIGMLDADYGDTFAGLDGLLGLADAPQVTVKLTSIPLLSREKYPHSDVWPHLLRVVEAFGPERLMWGSDHTVFDHDYTENIDVIRESVELGDGDKRLILGETVRRVWGWPGER